MTKPVIVFAPGAWHVPEHFDRVRQELTGAGYACIGIDLPGMTHEPRVGDRLLGIEDDTMAIRKAVVGQLDGGRDVVLVTHSYSSIPGAAALVALSTGARNNVGASSGVTGLVIISGFLLPPGTTMMAAMGGSLPPQYLYEGDVTTPFNGPGAMHILFNDVEQVVAEKAIWMMKPQSYGINTSATPDQMAGLSGISVSYLARSNDNAVPWIMQTQSIAGLRGAGCVVYAEVAPSGHSPFLKLPHETAMFIRRAAGESLETGLQVLEE